MMFDAKFRFDLESLFKKNREDFTNNCQMMVESLYSSCFRIALYSNFCDENDRLYSIDIIKENIKESVELRNNFVFIKKSMDWRGRFMNDNEITFWMKSMFSHKALTLEETKKKTDGKEVVLNECLKEYWLNKVNANGYKEIVPFDAYADFIIPKEETNLLKKEKARLNVQGWNKFLISILQHFFPQFFFRKDKSNVKLRFLKELNDDYLWGFEYDKNWLTKNRLGGGLGTLEDFNLILMHKDFDKRNKNNDYIYNPLSLEDENILSLGIMGNPVFFRPAFELSTFELRSYRKYRQVRHSINNEDDSVSVQHDQSHGEQIKQYLYFYIHVLSYTAQPYLEYLEKCILNKLNN